jgi:hypothetical protein
LGNAKDMVDERDLNTAKEFADGRQIHKIEQPPVSGDCEDFE